MGGRGKKDGGIQEEARGRQKNVGQQVHEDRIMMEDSGKAEGK